MRLLLIEDDQDLSDAVVMQLEKEGYLLDTCFDGAEADYYITSQNYDAIILDRLLPGKDGLTIMKELRAQSILVPVLMVTALGELQDRVSGLDAGADDYITKPFAIEELKARLRALLRRPRQVENVELLTFMNTQLDVVSLKIKTNQAETTLSKKETALLEYFIRNKNQVLSREQILSRVWGVDTFVEDGNIDTYIHFIRRRLRSIESDISIKTIHGIGYRLEEGVQE